MTRRGLFGLLGVPFVARALPTTPLVPNYPGWSSYSEPMEYIQGWHATVDGEHIRYTAVYFHRDAFAMTWPKLERKP